MIFRLTHKLNTRIQAGTLATLPLDENPFAGWSAGVFLVGRRPYILVSNTRSLYSTVLPGTGVTKASIFIESALASLREFLEADGYPAVYERLVAPGSGSVRFARRLDRSITGSLNDLTSQAAYFLAAGGLSLVEIGSRFDETPMSALKIGDSFYPFPRMVFASMVSGAG